MRLYVLLGILGASAPVCAAAEHFASGPGRVALIELYTSEGCSSCPPADAWLGGLKEKSGLWDEFVPVQFHVNYWDYLGWKDRLATKDFTAREYAYSSAWGSASVYTPCFVRNGLEWHPEWGSAGGQAAKTGVLSADLAGDGTCSVSFVPGPGARQSPDGRYEVHVAILGGGISSKVTAGENDGATLEHEFVVLGIAGQILGPNPAGTALVATLDLPKAIAVPCKRHALAVWVTPHTLEEPVQAAGGWLP